MHAAVAMGGWVGGVGGVVVVVVGGGGRADGRADGRTDGRASGRVVILTSHASHWGGTHFMQCTGGKKRKPPQFWAVNAWLGLITAFVMVGGPLLLCRINAAGGPR